MSLGRDSQYRRWAVAALGTTVIRQVLEERDGLYPMRFDLPLMGSHVIPMRIGDEWRIDLPGHDESAEGLVEGCEQTSWGLATKLRVTRTNLKTEKRWTDFEWYVDGDGLVQMEVTYGLRTRFALEKFEQPIARRTAIAMNRARPVMGVIEHAARVTMAAKNMMQTLKRCCASEKIANLFSKGVSNRMER